MNAVRQKCRPKHQVLVLKCYPRFQKGVQDVKPNSSELSYLLYYATTRRSKLQKVGAFWEKKTASDVWRQKLGNVQVTLQIITALIEKAPRDLPLYAGWVLTILDTVLRSKDINMIEESIHTFEAFCKHQDVPAATSISERSTKYQDIVKAYTAFASQEFLQSLKPAVSKPVSIRWRNTGLRAIRAAVESEGFGADGGKQLNTVLPVIMENLYSVDMDIFSALNQQAHNSEKETMLEPTRAGRTRRMSSNTVNTIDTIDANPLTAVSTTADADKAAEDEVRLLAVRCLKQIFAAGYATNRGQIRLATLLTLRFIALKQPPEIPVRDSRRSNREGSWATALIETVARWTPVQDRFIIVVTAMETLIRSPIVEDNLQTQLTLAELIDWLLSSNINLIGLSVMDVLLGFVQHIIQLLQLGGRDTKIAPHQQQSFGVDLFKDTTTAFGVGNKTESTVNGTSSTPSPVRQQLLLRLQKCIGDLATHIYYTDQVSDMIISVLARLKPSTNSDVSTAAAAIENPAAAANAIANSVNLQDDPTTDGFFSFATARVTALKAVKDILIVANLKKSMTGSVAETRSRVRLNVWEGTQWLLRDEDRSVREAYVDALLTWLQLETSKNDTLIVREDSKRVKSESKREGGDDNKIARRAISNASRPERSRKGDKSTFLQLLHLAVYENALEAPHDEGNILLLHLVMSSLIERLGVNAVRHGLPMILRLQDNVTSDEDVGSAAGIIGIGSLVHGYLCAVSEKFDFETSRVGAEINSEISRRRRKGVWLERVRFPALPISQISATSFTRQDITSADTSDAIRPFTNRIELVDEIEKAYDNSLLSPPASPPLSPGRVFSVPTLGFGYGYGATPGSKPAPEDQLPEKVKEDLLSEWEKDACIAGVEKDSAQTSSISGSKKTANGSLPGNLPRSYLAVIGNAQNGHASGNNSPSFPPEHREHHHASRPASAAYGLAGGLGSLNNLRRVSTQEGSPIALTPSSSRESTVRVNELKRVLSVKGGVRHSSPLRTRPKSRPATSNISDDSDSMVSFSDVDGADTSALDVTQQSADNQRPSTSPQPGNNHNLGVTNSTSLQNLRGEKEYIRPGSRHKDDDIPPVPKIPSSLNLPGGYPSDGSPVRPTTARSTGAHEQTTAVSPTSNKRGSVSAVSVDREGRSTHRSPRSIRPMSRKEKNGPGEFGSSGLFGHRADLGKLLAGIDTLGGGGGGGGTTNGGGLQVGNESRKRSGLSTPPY